MQIRHVGIVCRDMEKMKEYYKDLGLECTDDHTENVRIVKFKNGLELLKYESMSDEGLRKNGISHICFKQDPEGNFLEVVCE